jgi:hypothetical protein
MLPLLPISKVAVTVPGDEVVITVPDVVGKVKVVASVPARVRELLNVAVLPSRIVRVDPVAGVVRVILLIEVAIAAPKVGETKVGELVKATLPVPDGVPTATPPMAATVAAADPGPVAVTSPVRAVMPEPPPPPPPPVGLIICAWEVEKARREIAISVRTRLIGRIPR